MDQTTLTPPTLLASLHGPNAAGVAHGQRRANLRDHIHAGHTYFSSSISNRLPELSEMRRTGGRQGFGPVAAWAPLGHGHKL